MILEALMILHSEKHSQKLFAEGISISLLISRGMIPAWL
jgi:hypothetical protein